MTDRDELLALAKAATPAAQYDPRGVYPARRKHRCEDCTDCLHDGNKCCGCYDGACCTATADTDPAGRDEGPE